MGSPITKQEWMALHESEVLSINWKPLALNDRCDRCGAQAFVVAHHEIYAPLMFCGHHFNKHEAGLVGSGFQVQDERDKINKSPSISANAE